MSRMMPAAAALLLGLAAAPAFAQVPVPEDAAARTMQQNQRAFVPAAPRPQRVEAAKPAPVATVPAPAPRRFAQAEDGRP